jgi:hypothetical protein
MKNSEEKKKSIKEYDPNLNADLYITKHGMSTNQPKDKESNSEEAPDEI